MRWTLSPEQQQVGESPGSRPNRGQVLLRYGRALRQVTLLAVLLGLIALNASWAFRANELRDLGSFLASGDLAARGENPYAPGHPWIFRPQFEEIGPVESVNLNAPPLLLPMEFLARFDPFLVAGLWRIGSLLLYAVVMWLAARSASGRLDATRLLWGVSLAGFWHTVELGQVYLPLVLLWALALHWLRRGKEAWAGVALGLVVAVKPTIITVPVVLLIVGHLAAALSAALTAAAITILSLLRYGWPVYLRWLDALDAFSGPSVGIPGNSSLPGLFQRFDAAGAGTILGLALLVMVVVWAVRYRPSTERLVEGAMLGTLLASPLTWSGYTLFLLPFLLTRKWRHAVKTAAAILVVPVPLVLTLCSRSALFSVVLGWCYGWGLLLLTLDWFDETRKSVLVDDRGGPL